MSTSISANEYDMIVDVLLAFYKDRDYYDLLNSILSKMMTITNADGGTLYVREDNKLIFKIMRNVSQKIQLSAKDEINVAPISLNQSNIVNISAYAALNNEIVVIDDVYNNDRFALEGPKKYDKDNNYHTQSMLVLPLVATGNTEADKQVIGVIQLINSIDPATKKPRSFGDIFNPPLLPALSNLSANALANILYLQEIQELLKSFVRVMSAAIDERTPYNVNHTNNVAKYCTEFAQYLGENLPPSHPLHFNKHRSDQLILAAYLHDIGKLVTPLEIMDKADRLGSQLPLVHLKMQLRNVQLENQYLKGDITKAQYDDYQQQMRQAMDLIQYCNTAPFLSKEDQEKVQLLSPLTYQNVNGQQEPLFDAEQINSLCIPFGTLTAKERKIMQDHVSVTQRLLDQMTFTNYYKDVPFWAGNHHEYFDGTGYPYGMEGQKIPPEVSILTMMDVFDALTAIDRPYKKAKRADEALATIASMGEAGKFPKEIVDLFAKSKVWDIDQAEN